MPATVEKLLREAAAHYQAGRFAAAELLYAQVAAQLPNHSLALRMLGAIADRRGSADEALRHMQAAAAGDSPDASVMYNLALLLHRRQRLEEALVYYRKAVALKPDYVIAWHNLGVLLLAQGQLTEAEACCRQALASEADRPETLNTLGNILKEQGRPGEAVACYRSALAIKPDFFAVHSNWLQALCYADLPEGELFSEHQSFEARLRACLPATAIRRHPPRDRAKPRLRIGYVSPDFRRHSVAYFFEPILRSHDREAFETYCYSDAALPDAVTVRLRVLATRWRDIAGQEDEAVAALIRADEIDILVDLAGHSANNRLGVFYRRPAPLQVTQIGYPNTTGLAALAYRITDAWADPPEQASFYCEQLHRLASGFLCYQPPAEAPLPAEPPPVLKKGHVTFGSFNYLPKVSPAVLDAWAAVLQAVPGARLCLKARALQDEPTCRRYAEAFRQRGVSPDRLSLLGHSPGLAEHLASYGEIDIALDTFPYDGTTTTLEALWMGVPVVALTGSSHRSRVSFSLLSRIGLAGLAAPTPERYVALAVFLASDTQRLAQLRQGLRNAVARSPVCDAAGHTRALEAAYRQMWSSGTF